MIVGNKTDLERKLPFEEIEATVCLDWECGCAETSAYTGVGVHQVFIELLKQARNNSSNEEVSPRPRSTSVTRRQSLLKRLFSRDKAKDLHSDSCKIS